MKRLGKAIKGAVNEISLADATKGQLRESDAIKKEVLKTIQDMSGPEKADTDYQKLVASYDAISAIHDQIYNRPQTGSNPSSAAKDCDELVAKQRVLKQEFYAAVTALRDKVKNATPAVAANVVETSAASTREAELEQQIAELQAQLQQARVSQNTAASAPPVIFSEAGNQRTQTSSKNTVMAADWYESPSDAAINARLGHHYN